MIIITFNIWIIDRDNVNLEDIFKCHPLLYLMLLVAFKSCYEFYVCVEFRLPKNMKACSITVTQLSDPIRSIVFVLSNITNNTSNLKKLYNLYRIQHVK